MNFTAKWYGNRSGVVQQNNSKEKAGHGARTRMHNKEKEQEETGSFWHLSVTSAHDDLAALVPPPKSCANFLWVNSDPYPNREWDSEKCRSRLAL